MWMSLSFGRTGCLTCASCFVATRRHRSGEDLPRTAELRARAGHLCTDGISVFPWSAEHECRCFLRSLRFAATRRQLTGEAIH